MKHPVVNWQLDDILEHVMELPRTVDSCCMMEQATQLIGWIL